MTKHTCCAKINCSKSYDILRKTISNLPDEICGKTAKYFEDGFWFCGRHAPSKIEERGNLSYQKWVNKIKSKQNVSI